MNSDEMTDRRLRARVVADDWFALLVTGALLVAALGGFLAFGAYGEENTRFETRQVASWESTGEFDHSARVVNDTGPFEEGSILENRSTYFRSVTPVLNGTFTYDYEASDGGTLSVDATVFLVLRSVAAREDGNATEYWRVEEQLGNESLESLDPGDPATVRFSLNATAAEARAAAIEESLGPTPGETELFVEVRVDLSGTRNGERVDRTRTYRLPLAFETGVYRVEDPGAVTDGDTRREQVAVPVQASPLERIGGPLLIVAGLLVAGGLVLARRRGSLDVPEGDREYLAYRADREEYDEWITAADVPGGLTDGPRVEVDTLQGLVDLAIDTDCRVIEDARRDRYLVDGDRAWYVYEPPKSPGSDPDPAGTDPDPDGSASDPAGAEDGSSDGAGPSAENGSDRDAAADGREAVD